MKKILLSLLIALGLLTCQAQTWTYSDTVGVGSTIMRAYLWLPALPQGYVRGVILTSHTLAEEPFVQSSSVRNAAAANQMGIIYIKPSTLSVFNQPDVDSVNLKRVLDKLATASGFPEISHCPWLTFGHSTSSLFANKLAWWKPKRTIGAIIFKGGAIVRPPFVPATVDMLEVPFLSVSGQFEEYGPNGGCAAPRNSEANFWTNRDMILALRNSYNNPAASVMLPGEGHFDYSPKGDTLIAKWIDVMAKARIPQDTNARMGPINCIIGGNGQDLWFADTNIVSQAAAVSKTLTGPDLFMFYDSTLAAMWRNLQNSGRGKMRQLINPSPNAPFLSPGGLNNVTYVDCNGMQYRVNVLAGATYVVTGQSNMSISTSIRRTAGTGILAGGNSIRLSSAYGTHNADVYVNITNDGDANHLPGDRTLRMLMQYRSNGSAQTITPPVINNMAAGTSQALPQVLTSASLPAGAVVLYGPITIVGGNIVAQPFETLSGSAQAAIRFFNDGNTSTQTAQPVDVPFTVTGPTTVGIKRAPITNRLVEAYPNPTTGLVSLRGQRLGKLWQVYGLQGQLVASLKLNENQQLDITQLAEGVYTLRSELGQITKVNKLGR